MYILVKDNEVTLELTEKEYNETVRTIHKKRAEAVQKQIKELAITIGSAQTKAMVREMLKGL